MSIEYKEQETLGNGWAVVVRRSDTVIGHIRRHPTNGSFLYFRGPANILTPSYEDNDIANLKRRIESEG